MTTSLRPTEALLTDHKTIDRPRRRFANFMGIRRSDPRLIVAKTPPKGSEISARMQSQLMIPGHQMIERLLHSSMADDHDK